MISKLQSLSKITMAFLMALFSIWTWGQKTYQLVTSTSDLVAGSKYILASGASGTVGLMGWQNTNNRQSTSTAAVSSSKITVTPATQSTDQNSAYEITLGGATGAWTLHDDVNNIYLKATGGSSSNNLSSGSGVWTITFSSNAAVMTDTSNTGSRNVLRYNSSNNPPLFSCYISGNQSSVYLYKELAAVSPTVTGSNQTGSVGSTFSYQVQATNSPTAYAVASGTLPNGLSLNTTTGIISGTPTVADSFTIDVTATNGAGTSAPATINFTIAKGTQTLTGFTDQSKYLSSTPFTFPVNTTNANLAVTYTSSNNAVATVSGNTVTITGVGTANITAAQIGDSNWNTFNQQIVLTVVADPVTYNGVGRFEKITSLTDLTDGYYVIVGDETNAMNTTVTSNKLQATSVNVVSNQIVNPATSIVWKVQTDAGNVKTIFNDAVSKYVSNSGNSTDLSLVTSVSGTGQKWGVSVVSNLFRLTNQIDTSRALIFNGSIFGRYASSNVDGFSYFDLGLYKMVESTTWNGSAWSNGTPGSKDVIITGVYSTTSQPAFTAKNITIKNGGVLEITSGNTIGATAVTVEDGGNFIQRDGSTLTNTGAFNVLKNSTSEANKYVFWSSPVKDQNIYNIHGGGSSTPAYVTTYNATNNTYVNVANDNNNFINKAGVGYSVKVPVANIPAIFGGASKEPNSGNISIPVAMGANGYNLIGNPYPSDVNLTAFYNANSTKIGSTFYFWDNKSNAVTTSQGTTVNVGYATLNPASAAWVDAPNYNNSGTPSSVSGNSNTNVKIGQGFIVKMIDALATSVDFTNTMREGGSAPFFNKNVLNNNEGKFWLRLSSSYNTNNTLAVVYLDAASNTYDKYDSKAMATGSDAFYTLADTEKVIIQGRTTFNTNDVVTVGSKYFVNGNFTISLIQKEGVFSNGQAIYLHDKELGTYTNLQNGNYTFSTNAGEFTDRFEIVYKLGTLSTHEIEKTTFEVYRDGEEFVVKNSKNIDMLEAFDASGKKVLQLNPNTQVVKVKLDTRGMYILRATSGGKEYTKKIIK